MLAMFPKDYRRSRDQRRMPQVHFPSLSPQYHLLAEDMDMMAPLFSPRCSPAIRHLGMMAAHNLSRHQME